MSRKKIKQLGTHIVSDPEICGGELTFKGTRIFVQDVLDMVSKGYGWERISGECHGRVSQQAIAEAIDLARDALMEKTRKPRRVA